MSLPLVRYVLKAAVRDRLIITFTSALILVCALSMFLGSAAISETDQFAAIYAAGGIRLAGILTLILFIVFFIRRSFEARDIEYLLSRPIGRAQFLVSYAFAFVLIAVGVTAAQILSLYLLGPHLFSMGHVVWGVSILIENILISIAALFFSMWLSSAATGAMAVLGLYVLSRLSGEMLGIIYSHKGSSPDAVEFVMQAITVLVPRLDLFGQTSWLIYGVDSQGIGFMFLILQGLLYSALMILAALYDLLKRQF
jgi:hypothetical protein